MKTSFTRQGFALALAVLLISGSAGLAQAKPHDHSKTQKPWLIAKKQDDNPGNKKDWQKRWNDDDDRDDDRENDRRKLWRSRNEAYRYDRGELREDILRDILNRRQVDNYVLNDRYWRNIRRANAYELPPGIAKNVARGKKIPPGIRKKMAVLPTDLNRRIGLYNRNTRVGVIDDDVILYDPQTDIITDILNNILY